MILKLRNHKVSVTVLKCWKLIVTAVQSLKYIYACNPLFQFDLKCGAAYRFLSWCMFSKYFPSYLSWWNWMGGRWRKSFPCVGTIICVYSVSYCLCLPSCKCVFVCVHAHIDQSSKKPCFTRMVTSAMPTHF